MFFSLEFFCLIIIPKQLPLPLVVSKHPLTNLVVRHGVLAVVQAVDWLDGVLDQACDGGKCREDRDGGVVVQLVHAIVVTDLCFHGERLQRAQVPRYAADNMGPGVQG